MLPGLKAYRNGQSPRNSRAMEGHIYHLDPQKRVGAVVEQIARFPVVDAHDAEHQRAAQAQREGRLGAHNLVDVLLDLVLQDLLLGELLFGIGRQPDVGQRAGALQQLGRVEHCGGGGGGARARVEAWALELCARSWFVVIGSVLRSRRVGTCISRARAA